jgi:very-short-patch-repair endonuclease
MGYPFRRQRPILQYIVDFWCKNLNLIIEVDGASHDRDGASERDAVRQKKLEELGFKVIRFRDEEVLEDSDGVVSRIGETIREIERVGGVVIPLKDRRKP